MSEADANLFDSIGQSAGIGWSGDRRTTMTAERTMLTFQQAAKRVRRQLRTIRRWKMLGMTVEMIGGVNYVDEEVLLAFLRERTKLNPVHEYRVRKLSNERV